MSFDGAQNPSEEEITESEDVRQADVPLSVGIGVDGWTLERRKPRFDFVAFVL